MHQALIAGIEYYLPDNCITSQNIIDSFPEWLSSRKVLSKIGINNRYITHPGECASDLAIRAAEKLFSTHAVSPRDIDYILSCTTTPDYIFPSNACIIQDGLKIPTQAGALDFSPGCSGFVYGLGLAHGLIISGQARSILLITAETVTKYIDENDRGCRAIFGDGAAATWITGTTDPSHIIGPFEYGTDGRGAKHLLLPNSGTRRSPRGSEERVAAQINSQDAMVMNGSEIVNFSLDVVPGCVTSLINKAGILIEHIDLFVFHQANAYLLDELRKILAIPKEKFQVAISDCANTVSSTIPIALTHANAQGRLSPGNLVMLVGFGIGYSWAATLIRWTGLSRSPTAVSVE